MPRTNPFHTNPQIGKTGPQLDAERTEAGYEESKRSRNGLDVEDQQARLANLNDARARLN